ncbi:response regulator transcription factor [Candidatus Sumerlaeota bacterium]|nr:response regulator transcription factor [Candidatus Sumerlaeota bacterium]
MKLLVVEDYEPLARSLGEGLRESGYAVDVSRDGEEGLWYAETNRYDALILDIMLPGIDGLTILRRLREKGCNTPVLLLTARTAIKDRVEGIDAGADDYLTKPFAFEELLSRVRALVRRVYQQRSPDLEVSDLKIDTVRRTVERAGKPVALTPREFAILEYLARRTGEVVSRTEIWEHVYDFRSEAASNVVDVHISSLRKKIDEGNAIPLIHTRRGEGYVLEERA